MSKTATTLCEDMHGNMEFPKEGGSPTQKQAKDSRQLGELSAESINKAWPLLSEPAKVVEQTQPQADEVWDALDASDIDDYEPGFFLRQVSEPTKFSRQYSEPAKSSFVPAVPIGLPPGIRVKNTFLDFGDFELENVRWNATKPAKIQVREQGRGQAPRLAEEEHRFGKLGSSEADTNRGSDLSHLTASTTTSTPESPLSKPGTPESASPRLHLQPQPRPEAFAAAPFVPQQPVAPAGYMCQMAAPAEPACPGGIQGANIVTVLGLPKDCSTKLFEKEVWDAGFSSQRDFDFLFVPRDLSDGSAMGCAFVNFSNPHTMRSFMSAFQGRHLRYMASSQALTVSPATFQDLLAVTGQRGGMQAAAAAAQPRFCTSCGFAFEGKGFNFCPRCGVKVGGR